MWGLDGGNRRNQREVRGAVAWWTVRLGCVSSSFLPRSVVCSLLTGDEGIASGGCGSRLRSVCGQGAWGERLGYLVAQVDQDGVNSRPVLLRLGSLFLVVGRD